MLKVYRNVFVVLCIAALAGMFVGTVTADYIYDFDTHVGQTLTAGQSLTGQDNWEVRTGNSAYKDNIWVGNSTSGWTGNYAYNTSSDGGASYMIRPNDGNWSFSLLDGQNIEVSAVISNNGSGITTQIGLEHDYGYGKNNWIVFGINNAKFDWFVREGDGTNYTILLSLTPAMSDTSDRSTR